ncbi:MULTISPECIES: hypothetical protein [Comamonas]|uniref:hypothetical protein n=1 Tax=Comamonas TaxID=283 RepID=UPI000F4DA070|nr:MULTISPECIES: hypothetical protein [Comamonas]MDH1252422.1 hypothetical protein [Comamonas thiooxydans]MDH1476757.1 hypothetical protein [Comamonas thiooxydans]TFF58361.1 hypothetical protein EIC84_16730 [Comamonas sp. A23]TYK74061.1 hypothetical protein FSY45_21045 [Comamonas sp. Z1]
MSEPKSAGFSKVVEHSMHSEVGACRFAWQALIKEVGIDGYQFSEYLTCEFRWQQIMQAAVSILRAS